MVIAVIIPAGCPRSTARAADPNPSPIPSQSKLRTRPRPACGTSLKTPVQRDARIKPNPASKIGEASIARQRRPISGSFFISRRNTTVNAATAAQLKSRFASGYVSSQIINFPPAASANNPPSQSFSRRQCMGNIFWPSNLFNFISSSSGF